MVYRVRRYRFNPPGPSFDLTNTEKAAWPKIWESTALLNDYPNKHEVLGLEFYISHRLYEGHGTHWNAKYYNRADDKLIFESDHDIPNPSTGGWTWWNWYRLYSWIGHCSWEINGPMEIRVMVTITSNILPTFPFVFDFTVNFESEEPDACTWDWFDIPGSIMCYVFSAIDALFGWQSGTFQTLIGNVWDFFTNSIEAIYDFFADVIGSVIDIIKENVGSIFDWLTAGLADLFDFLGGLVGDAFENIKKFFADIADFVGDKFMGFVDWILEIGGSVADYIGGAIGDFVDWSADQLGGIWDGVTGFFMEAISGFIDAFFGGVETGIEQAKHSPLHSDEPVRNPVLEGLRKVVREHRKKYNEDEITGDWKNGRI